MLWEGLWSALSSGEEVKKIILNLPLLKKRNEVVKRVIPQVFLEEVSNEVEHYPFGNKAVLEQRLEHGLGRKRQLLRECEGSEDCHLFSLVLLKKLEWLEKPVLPQGNNELYNIQSWAKHRTNAKVRENLLSELKYLLPCKLLPLTIIFIKLS